MNVEYFKTKGRGVSDVTLMVNNRLTEELFKRSLATGNVVDITDSVKNIFAVISCEEAFKVKGMSEQISHSIQDEINNTGGSLKMDYYKKHRIFLSSTYQLLGLCYVSVKKKGSDERVSFLATKNDVTLEKMLDFCDHKGLSKDKLEKLRSKRVYTDEEFANCYLNVIKFTNNGDGKFKIGTCRVYPNSSSTIILPYICVRHRAMKIITALSKGSYRIKYMDGGKEREICTNLCNGLFYNRAIQGFNTDLCLLPVSDINNGKEFMLNTLNIKGMKALK